MAERKLTTSKDETHRAAPPASGSSAPSEVLSQKQGTNSVRGTCSSEGEAGRHLLLQAGSEEGTSSSKSILHRLERIAAQARQYPDMQFTTLAHLLDEAMLERAFWSLKPDSAPGVDRVTWHDYKRNLLQVHDFQTTFEAQYRPRRLASPGFRPLFPPAHGFRYRAGG